MKAIARFINTAFHLACILLAIYYSILQGERYFRNEDASVVSFRTFNQRQHDDYPDFTFCIENGYFNPMINEFGMKRESFSNVLKGNAHEDSNAAAIEDRIINLDPKMYFKSVDDIIQSYKISNNLNTTSSNGNDNRLKSVASFLLPSHQTPETQCLTRHSIFESKSNIIRRQDELTFKIGLPDDNESDITFKIYVHASRQFMESMERPIFSHTFHYYLLSISNGLFFLMIYIL